MKDENRRRELDMGARGAAFLTSRHAALVSEETVRIRLNLARGRRKTPPNQAARRELPDDSTLGAFFDGRAGGSEEGTTSVELTGSGSVATRSESKARVMAEKIIAWLNRHWVRAPVGKIVPVHHTTRKGAVKLR